ncbi:hypothetical protein, partial [Pelagicoccus sp. SDUM812005]|uniref:hypothetical protein n=1 Tax=Pelagicoccus sp. SDUM812005 TaxID=3041257 RepID=UPI00280FFC5C
LGRKKRILNPLPSEQTHMKSIILFYLLCTSLSVCYAETRIGIEANYLKISGIRSYGAGANNGFFFTAPKSSRTVSPYLSFSPNSRSTFKVRYTNYEEISSSGFSGDSNIFKTPGIFVPQVPVFFSIEEEIKEYSLSYLFRIGSIKSFDFALGPSLSVFDSNAAFYFPESAEMGPFATRKETDVELGFESLVAYAISDDFNAEFSYRYSTPPQRHIHLLSISLNFKL